MPFGKRVSAPAAQPATPQQAAPQQPASQPASARRAAARPEDISRPAVGRPDRRDLARHRHEARRRIEFGADQGIDRRAGRTRQGRARGPLGGAQPRRRGAHLRRIDAAVLPDPRAVLERRTRRLPGRDAEAVAVSGLERGVHAGGPMHRQHDEPPGASGSRRSRGGRNSRSASSPPRAITTRPATRRWTAPRSSGASTTRSRTSPTRCAGWR